MNTPIQPNRHRPASAVTLVVLACGLLIAPWTLANHANDRAELPVPDAQLQAESSKPEKKPADRKAQEAKDMLVHYLEIVTPDVDQVCAAYSATSGVTFGKPEAGLGNARTAPMPGGGMVGVRAPMRETESPIVRPYWLVSDIKSALAAARKAGGQVAMEPTPIKGRGTFAIYVQGGVDHGLWEK